MEVNKLVQYIRTVQMGEGSSERDEVYDSQDDVSGVPCLSVVMSLSLQLSKLQYNLHLLKAMLECNAVDSQVDQTTYSHIIKMWVKDVRGRIDKSPPHSPPLEVSECVCVCMCKAWLGISNFVHVRA